MAARNPRRLRLSRPQLDAHYKGFLRSLRSKRPETRGTYERALREFVRWFRKDRRFQFLSHDVERYKRYLSHTRKLSPVSVSTYLTAVRRFCAYLVTRRVLRANPATEVEGNKRPARHSREPISSGEVDRLLTSIDCGDERGLRDFAVIKLMVGCALSEIEIVRADVGDVRHEDAGAVLAVQGKGRTEKDDVVALPPDVKESIDRYLEVRRRIASNEPLFTSAGNRTRGMRMTTRGVRDRVNAYLEQAGIKQGKLRKITPYSLRHTAAVLMAENGASADEIRRRLRLGSVATAMLYINRKNEAAGATPQRQTHND